MASWEGLLINVVTLDLSDDTTCINKLEQEGIHIDLNIGH